MKGILIIFTALLFFTSQGFTHSGRTDSNGGHNCSQASKDKGLCTGYHYHNSGRAIQGVTPPIRNSQVLSGSGNRLEVGLINGSASVSRLIRVYDGDTIFVDIDELPDLIGKNIPIRIRGMDSPEINGKCLEEKNLAAEARDRARYLLEHATSIVLENMERGSFFRIVADVIVDNVSVADLRLNEGLAVPYEERNEKSWCL